MERADRESGRLGQAYVGPEHVLAALAADESVAGRVLRRFGLAADVVRTELDHLVVTGVLPGRHRSDTELLSGLGIDLAAVRDAVDEAFGAATVEATARRVARRGNGSVDPWCRPPGAREVAVRRALECAQAEADQEGRDAVGPEHVLLGLLHDAENPPKLPRCFKLPRARQMRARQGRPEPDRPSPVIAIFRSRGVSVSALHEAVLAELSRAGDPPRDEGP
jgi:ATP-dependent Clp protease ATP-binding subunit ClpA